MACPWKKSDVLDKPLAISFAPECRVPPFWSGADQILTNAHIFVDEIGKDRANLGKCFWQNKEEPFRRVPLDVTSETVKLFTRSTNEEFYLDLAVVR